MFKGGGMELADQAQPAIIGPAGRGWKISEGGSLQVMWSKEEPLPKELVDILCDEEVHWELVNICDGVHKEGFDENDQWNFKLLDVQKNADYAILFQVMW